MKYGISLIMRGSESSPEAFARVAERAEALEYDSLWCSDHIIVPDRSAHAYIGMPNGEVPQHWKEGYWEPFTVLAYLSALTKKIALGTSVCILPMRNPIEVAGFVTHLDRLSGGRFIFGVGVGWFEEEFDALRWPFRERGARCDEGLALARTLWTEARPRFKGRFYEFADVHFNPKPVQKPHPPVWVAGSSPGALRRTARYADGWHPYRPSFAALEQGKAALAPLLAQEGRKLAELAIAPKGHVEFRDSAPAEDQWPLEGRPADMVAGVRRFAELGASHLVLDYRPETVQQALDTMERFAQEVRAKV